MVVCARMFESKQDESSTLVRMSAFDLDNNRDDYDQVERDYGEIRNCIKIRGFKSLSGKMEVLFNLELKDPYISSSSRLLYLFFLQIYDIDYQKDSPKSLLMRPYLVLILWILFSIFWLNSEEFKFFVFSKICGLF